MLPKNLRCMRSADSWIGVSGFLISCASRRATSPQAASRCACSSVVMSSNTSTTPGAPPTSLGSAVHAHTSTRCRTRTAVRSVRASPAGRRRAAASRRRELREQRAVADGFVESLADRRFQVDTEDGARRLVRRAHRQVRFQRHHPGRQARQDDRETRPLRLHRLLAAAGLLARAPHRLVMSLKEVTRNPSSSRDGSGSLVS